MTRGIPSYQLRRETILSTTVAAAVLCAAAAFTPARADDAPAADPHAIKVNGLVEAGFYGNTADSGAGVNAGQLLTDKHDQFMVNQLMLTVERDLDPAATGFDWGFKLQGLYGTDARYSHYLGIFDRNTDSRYQGDITEADLQFHLPVLAEGGIDTKLGAYPTPLGFEYLQANNNFLYSHSYISNFGVPIKHTGLLTVSHLNPTVDLYLGIDTGVNSTFGSGDPNGRLSGIAGLGFNNLLDGKLTITALSHFGPANAKLTDDQPNGLTNAAHKGRYYGDFIATYKPDDLWTWVTEIDYVRDDAPQTTSGGARAYGISQYGIYALTPSLTLVGRAEIFADPQGFFVSSYGGNRDPVNVERGLPYDQTIYSPGLNVSTTYGELTLGVNYKLPGLPERLAGTMLRPEIRFDRSLGGNNAFDYDSSGIAHSSYQISGGMDVVIPISIF
jgi:hypothetical protein